MQPFKPLKIELSIKDSTKGQKIASALYLVTDHMSDTDPIRQALRASAVSLLSTTSAEALTTIAASIAHMLTTAVMARLLSEKNASIIVLELRHLVGLSRDEGDTVTEALRETFEPVIAPESLSLNTRTSSLKTRQFPVVSIGQRHTETLEKKPTAPAISQDSKTKRQEQILSFINDRKSVGIKDIATLFPDTSEKTIQRELGALVTSGRITKRGQKRWSVYMAVSA